MGPKTFFEGKSGCRPAVLVSRPMNCQTLVTARAGRGSPGSDHESYRAKKTLALLELSTMDLVTVDLWSDFVKTLVVGHVPTKNDLPVAIRFPMTDWLLEMGRLPVADWLPVTDQLLVAVNLMEVRLVMGGCGGAGGGSVGGDRRRGNGWTFRNEEKNRSTERSLLGRLNSL